ncbi:vitamin B12-dependent ribonucleotide reductase [Aminiphilus circumscriptus]|jgi:ribonucleoside-diphosphate reductase alpha chain|uniref:vitamin B12-dependent ribonucleotide reductase n=1 Tax=Aminiphilus circumscriptus TaxID=290732 RepID=UPI0004B07651|nr:vitamin B12-dependent ribonucleotide reductase [Aminiphilus circumscriptus]
MTFSENALVILKKRYLKGDETPQEMLRRVAKAVAAAEPEAERALWEERFTDLMAQLDFLPNSPTLMNAGIPEGQLAACFVLPIEDSMDSIFSTLRSAALIHKSGGGTGYNFSKLRPAGDVVSTTNGVASGPISFMRMFDLATDVVKQGGTRRGANMGILNCDHPDVLAFIRAKTEEGILTNFNISVGITDRFMEALADGKDWHLVNPRTGQTTDTVKSMELWNRIVHAAWATGDPGVIFLDRLERDNPTPHVGRITSTNPCGEQPLLPYEACNLGSVNLKNMVRDGEILWDRLEKTVRTAVRFLDDVIDINCYPLPEIEDMVKGNRKIGLGVMGWAEMLFLLGIPYDSEEALELAEKVMAFIQATGREASRDLARERHPYPNCVGEPLRNATVTTIAPTGTIALLAECSSGIEPVFALTHTRKAFGTEDLVYVNDVLQAEMHRRGLASLDSLPLEMKRVFVTAHEIDYPWHVRMQAAFQKFTDNAVSKTVNLPADATKEDVRKAYLLAYELGCKGITVYRDGCKASQVLTTTPSGKKDDTVTHQLVMPMGNQGTLPLDRPQVLTGKTIKMPTSYGNLYLTVNETTGGRPFEVFATLGKSGKDTQAHTEALGRLISLALRTGIPAPEIVNQLKGIGGSQPVWDEDGVILSLPDAIAKCLERALGMPVHTNATDMCPGCGAVLVREEGCVTCHACGYSKC